MACSIQEQRNSFPNNLQQSIDLQWTNMAIPVSSYTHNLRLTMMNQNPKDLHTARLIIEELRTKVRHQAEHIMKWRKAYALQIQQHYRYQKEKTDQMNSLTSQLLLLESRLKRKQKQIVSILNHREITIQRQQKIIDALSGRLVDHGLEPIEANYAIEIDSLNDSDSAVVLEDIDSDYNVTIGSHFKNKIGFGNATHDGITIARSISDAVETNLNKYIGARRNNCYLRRPDILETVYSVEEDPEPSSDVAEKRDKFKNRSEKVLSSSSTEGQIDTTSAEQGAKEKTRENGSTDTSSNPIYLENFHGCYKENRPSIFQKVRHFSIDDNNVLNSNSKSLIRTESNGKEDINDVGSSSLLERAAKSQVNNYNRVMSNHRSVIKPKDVKYKRINKAKSKSLEELRGRLKNLVERGSPLEQGGKCGYKTNNLVQTAQSYA